jgi:hypothetical protein
MAVVLARVGAGSEVCHNADKHYIRQGFVARILYTYECSVGRPYRSFLLIDWKPLLASILFPSYRFYQYLMIISCSSPILMCPCSCEWKILISFSLAVFRTPGRTCAQRKSPRHNQGRPLWSIPWVWSLRQAWDYLALTFRNMGRTSVPLVPVFHIPCKASLMAVGRLEIEDLPLA